jgi:hypothetical protein
MSQTSTSDDDAKQTLSLHEFFAVTPVYENFSWEQTKSATTKQNLTLSMMNPQLSGFQLHTYKKIADNILQGAIMTFQSHKQNEIEQWYQLLSNIIFDRT